MDIFFEIHRDLPREGPGDEASTRAAYAMMTGLPEKPRILDIGCGPGMQTLVLARVSGGDITAIDTHTPFLDALEQKAQAAGLGQQITTRNMSMKALEFAPGSFDVVWSEGAVYIMGFEAGLRAWKPYLKPGGYIAVTEVSWIKQGLPAEVRDYWESEYPEIRATEANLEIIRGLGYQVTGHFALPPSSWWDDYYRPLQERLVILREKYRDDPAALEALAGSQKEIEVFKQYNAWYSYVFYIMQAV